MFEQLIKKLDGITSWFRLSSALSVADLQAGLADAAKRLRESERQNKAQADQIKHLTDLINAMEKPK